MNYVKRTALFITVTIIFTLITAFCISATVVSQGHISDRALHEYRKEQEKEYVTELRGYLAKQGYHNSGVTLTSVTDAEGSRTYTATIHHAGIDRLTQEERTDLKRELASVSSVAEGRIIYEFLLLNY